MRHPARLRALATALAAAATVAGAAPPASAPPTEIDANEAEFDDRTGISVYRGDVHVVRGGLRLNGAELTVHTEKGQLIKAIMVGQPADFHQARENEPPLTGEARRIEYYAVERRVVLIDDARLEQARDRFTGEHIVYEMDTEQVRARGADEGDRVHVTIHPETAGKDDERGAR